MAVRIFSSMLPLLIFASSVPVAAQVEPLPPVEWPQDQRGAILLDEYAAQQPPCPPPNQGREGVFQRMSFTGTWQPDSGSDGLGWSDLAIDTTFGFPFPTRESPLLITPTLAVHYLDGPATPDLPARLYDVSAQFRWLRQLNDLWAMDVAVEPGVHSDWEHSSSDALRITGRGLGVYQWDPVTKLVLGVAYLDRHDVSVLPVGGVIYTPSDAWRWELVVPRPKIARRIYPPLGTLCDEHWAYVAGEFGGGSWSIERASGAEDEISARDYRVMLGLERVSPGALGWRCEVGYVFGREVEYESSTPDFQPGDTLMLRAGATY